MRIKKLMMRAVILMCALGLTLSVVHQLLKPNLLNAKEIYKGVYLTIEDIDDQGGDKSRVMMTKIQWDTPGLEIYNRKFSYPVDSDNSEQFHYRLSYADYALRKEGASVLVNTTLYRPAPIWRIFPGLPVRTNETIVQNGAVSHVHDHSYLLYWDRNMNLQAITAKPPDRLSLEKAWIGIGLQGIQINNGKPAQGAIDTDQEQFDRTFIGVNPSQKTLYLFAFQNVTAETAVDYAVAAGVQYGGSVDSGNSSNLLIGYNANGIFPHTGVRNSRPLGAYLVVKADRL